MSNFENKNLLSNLFDQLTKLDVKSLEENLDDINEKLEKTMKVLV